MKINDKIELVCYFTENSSVMKTRSQTRSQYEIQIDFDEASRCWNMNKIKIGEGMYAYKEPVITDCLLRPSRETMIPIRTRSFINLYAPMCT